MTSIAYNVTIGVKEHYRVQYRDITIEVQTPIDDSEIIKIALSRVHVHIRYRARVTDISVHENRTKTLALDYVSTTLNTEEFFEILE